MGLDLDVSAASGRRFDAVGGVVQRRRHPLSDTLEVDLDGVDRSARDRRRLGARHVVELRWLDDERRRPIHVRASVVLSFRQRSRRAQLTHVLACTSNASTSLKKDPVNL